MTEKSETLDPQMPQPKTRLVGGTEYSWCIAVPGGTGTTVLGLLLSKPLDIPLLQTALHKLQKSHPILRSKIRLDSSTNTFHYVTPPDPQIQITSFDQETTSQVIDSDQNDNHIDPFLLVHEHEMNRNTWHDPSDSSSTDAHVFHVSVYTISEHRWAMFLRLHTSACDRTAAVTVLRKLLVEIGGGGGGVMEGEGTDMEMGDKDGVNLAIEDLIPKGKANKPFWARCIDVLGYSLNSFRLAHLNFVDANSPRSSKVVRLRLDRDETERLINVSDPPFPLILFSFH